MIIKTGTDLSYLNYGNEDLTGQITLSQVVTAKDVTDMRYMYANCPNITSVTAYEYSDRIDVTYIAYSYSSSYIDDNVKIAYKFNYAAYTYTNVVTKFEQPKTGFVKDMNHMFANCYGLTEANLAYMDFSDCTNMQGMFDNCYNLQTVVFGRYACNALLHLQDIFSGCYSLDRVYVPFELKDDVENIIGHAGLHSYFYNANYNIEDTLPKITTSYYFDKVSVVCTYTTLTVNNIGAFIVEADFDYHNSNVCILDIYGNGVNDPDYKLMLSYTTKTPTNNDALELSDITEPFSERFILSNEYNLKADLSVMVNNEKLCLKNAILTIDNQNDSRYIDIYAYLIYFPDIENAHPISPYTNTYLSQSKIIADTYNWFFSDIKRVKYLDPTTFTHTYSYETSFDTYAYVTYKVPGTDAHFGIYGTLLTLNNELDDNYEGGQTEYPVSVGYMYTYYYNE